MASLSTVELETYDEKTLMKYCIELGIVGGETPMLMKNKGLMVNLIMKYDEGKKLEVDAKKIVEAANDEDSDDEESSVSFDAFFDNESEDIYDNFSPDTSEEMSDDDSSDSS